MGLNTVTIPCKGGLNLSSTDQELLAMPNEAIQLVNMESSKSGGYRRISGYTETDTSIPGTGEVKGIFNYRGGILGARGTGLYHSFDGISWLQVNKDVDAADSTAVALAAEVPLSTADEQVLQFEVYTKGTTDHLYIATGNSDPLYLKIEGDTEVTATYTFRTTTLDSELTGAKWITEFQDQIILGNTTANPSIVIYSSLATTDLTQAELAAGLTVREKYNGSTSGFVSVKRPVTGIKVHRETLYIFTAESIHKVQGLRDGNAVVKPVTEKVGCVDGNTIQEIGGDVVFLAPDGLRTISSTDRIDDIELGVISRKIAPITDKIMDNLSTMTFTSAVLPSKNQYRLWYRNSNLPSVSQRGIIAAYAYDSGTGGFRWDYSEMEGWEATCASAGSTLDRQEQMIHGDTSGKVYFFERGQNFNGTKMRWVYQSPYTDFGDIGIRKNIHKVIINMKPEGDVNANLELKYDYEGSDVFQPLAWELEEINQPAIFGGFVFGDPLVKFGASTLPDQDIYTEGSGFAVSFRVRDRSLDDSSFEIQSIQVNFTPSGRI